MKNLEGVKVYATEFKTIINEPYIKIPDYELFKGHEVRITLLNIDKGDLNNLDKKEKEEDFIEFLTKNPVKVKKDFKFLSREEANGR